MDTTDKLPFDKGYDAAMAGRPESDNPYLPDDWRYKEWADGYENVMVGRLPPEDAASYGKIDK